MDNQKKIWLENMTEAELDQWALERSAIIRGKALAHYDAVRDELEARQKEKARNCPHANLRLQSAAYNECILYCDECCEEFYEIEIKLIDNGLYKITSFGKSLK